MPKLIMLLLMLKKKTKRTDSNNAIKKIRYDCKKSARVATMSREKTEAETKIEA